MAVLPSDGAFEALRGGRMLVACFRLGRLEEALEANYSAQLDVLAALTGLLDMTVETEAELAADARCLLDPTLVRLIPTAFISDRRAPSRGGRLR